MDIKLLMNLNLAKEIKVVQHVKKDFCSKLMLLEKVFVLKDVIQTVKLVLVQLINVQAVHQVGQ